MRSGTDGRRWLCALALAVLAALTPPAAAAQDNSAGAAPGAPGAPGADDISRALTLVKADPNLAAERTIKTLRWNESKPSASMTLPGWLRTLATWIGGSVSWLNETTRALWWLAAATLAGVLVVFLIRLVRARSPSFADGGTFVPPTHVLDLDIRPETLPGDIGAAARALWDRGEARAALALLYRGLLSRLAHVHRVPIRDSSTEGDCLALSAGHLPATRYDYATRLVQVWQRAVYGGEQVPTAAVHALCIGFGPALDRTTQAAVPAAGETA